MNVKKRENQTAALPESSLVKQFDVLRFHPEALVNS
jgi:hypothetical protein